MHSNNDGFNAVLSSSEQLFKLAKTLELADLEEKVPEYTKAIQKYFSKIDKNRITAHDVENLKKIMSRHEMITGLFNRKKEEVSKNIKHLHAGKDMQNTYPQTFW